jgi:preprotein translocase SecE subunit
MLKKLKAYKFFDQVKQEAKKVVWPEKKELIVSAAIVIGVVFVFSFLTMILDYSLHSLMKFFLNIGK